MFGKGFSISAPLVLIIDENPVDRQLAAAILQQEFPELQWRGVTDEAGLEEALAEGGYQAALLDYWLHWSTGLEVARRLRERSPETVLIFFSGEVSDAIRTRIFQAAPDDFVPKSPSGFLLLPGVLRRHLSKARRRPAVASGEAHLDLLLEKSELGRFRATPEGRLVAVNSVLQKLLGVSSPAEAGSVVLPLHFRAEDRRQLREEMRRGVRVHRGEISCARPDGGTIRLEVTETIVEDPAGNPWIEGLAAPVQDDDASKDALSAEFASVAAHQLQEPLRMVAQYTRLLAERFSNRLDEEGREYLDFAHGGAKRMQQQVDGLLAYGRAGKRELKAEECDPAGLIQGALTDLRLLIEERRAVVTWNGLPRISGDCEALGQVFHNLIANAVKYYAGDEVPYVRIWCERRGEEHWFFVRDNGPGVGEKDREKIFEPFQRASSRVPGSGLGLAVCRRIVSRHGGRIWVESESGQGATFVVALPVSPLL